MSDESQWDEWTRSMRPSEFFAGCPIGPAGPVGCAGDNGVDDSIPVGRELTVPELKKYIFGLVRDLPRADREELVDVLSKEFGK